MNFEWNPKKALENFSKHGVSFSEAERGENYRIISTREAENYEREIYDQARSDDAFYQ